MITDEDSAKSVSISLFTNICYTLLRKKKKKKENLTWHAVKESNNYHHELVLDNNILVFEGEKNK